MTDSSDPEVVLQAFFAACPTQSYLKGELISGGAVTTQNVLFIQNGFVKCYTITDEGERHILLLKAAGDMLAATNLFTKDDSTLFFEAMTDVTVSRVPRHKYEVRLRKDITLALATMKKLIQDMRDTTKRLENLNIADARHRLIARLLFLAERFGAHSVNSHLVIMVPMTHEDLAESIRLRRETVNRIFAQLEEENLVTKSRQTITLTDPTRLQAEVAGYTAT